MTQKFVVVFLLFVDIIISNGFTMKMIPIDSPHLNIIPNHLTSQETEQYRVNISVSRSRNTIQRKNLNLTSFTIPAYQALTNFYVTTLYIGGDNVVDINHPRYALLDTGSSFTWVQCEGCNPCFQTKSPNFDYQTSPAFSRMQVHDRNCVPYLEYDGSCGFQVKYVGTSSARGFVGYDNFHLWNPRTGQFDVYPKLFFGCGMEMEGSWNFGLNKGPENIIGGVYGLGPHPRSFLNQLKTYTLNRFSYCLAYRTDGQFSTSTVFFGNDAEIRGDATRQVVTISMNTQVSYNLYLNGISVDGNRLSIDPSVFEFDPGMTKGFIIDTGSPYTVLAGSAHDILVNAVDAFFRRRFNWKAKLAIDRSTFQLCYRQHFSEDEDDFPTVVLHFAMLQQPGERDMVLKRDNMFGRSHDGFCMMVLPQDEDDPRPSFLGAVQLSNFRILIDVPSNTLSFVPEMCAQD